MKKKKKHAGFVMQKIKEYLQPSPFRAAPPLAGETFRGRRRLAARLTLVLAAAFYLCAGWPLAFGAAGGLPEAGDRARAADTGLGGGADLPAAYAGETEPPPAGDIPLPAAPEPAPHPTVIVSDPYTVQPGDTISGLAAGFGLNQDTLISVNRIQNSRGLQPGRVLKIPTQDGILYEVKDGDTLASIAEAHNVEASLITAANELLSEKLPAGISLFLPGAKLDWEVLQEINGDLFFRPVRGRLTSYYGVRRSPFTGAWQRHDGIDLAAPQGTPVMAAMAGTVIAVAYNDPVYGINVWIRHPSGWRTRYGHMSSAKVEEGDAVTPSTVIGTVGSTGISTGPHLHFSAYRNSRPDNPLLYLKN